MGLTIFNIDKEISLKTKGFSAHLYAQNGWKYGPARGDDAGDYGTFVTKITLTMPEGNTTSLMFYTCRYGIGFKERDYAEKLRKNRTHLAADTDERLIALELSDVDTIADELAGIIPAIKKAAPLWEEGDDYIPDSNSRGWD